MVYCFIPKKSILSHKFLAVKSDCHLQLTKVSSKPKMLIRVGMLNLFLEKKFGAIKDSQ